MRTSFAVLGDGAWGTAIALLLAQDPRHRVTLWSAREDSGRVLRERRENVRLLPGVPIPEAVELTTDVARAVDGADLWVMAIPTVYLRATLARVAPALRPAAPVLSLAKGLENETFLRPTEIVTEVLGVRRVAVLSGPSHAEEVSRGLPTSVVAASTDLGLARQVQQAFATERFRVYTNLDPVGVELGGALKNVIGIAAGISDGLGFGDNAKSALLTRGLVEMTRFGVALGAEPQTFAGLAGLGDLITTCVSRHGRNRRVGERLGRGERLADILGGMSMVAEGVYTARSVHERAARMGIDMPITAEVYRVLYEGKDPRAAVDDLMLRAPKGEGEPA
jgi:glycerol-3-phosphate dehydrogenase (NAD(P)+)